MSKAQEGQTVKVHYTGKLEDGTVFDSSKDRQPLEFTLGGGNVIPGFEKAVSGMEVGESKTVTIRPEEAYGHKRDELIVEVKKSEIPKDIDPSLGQKLQIKQPNGQIINLVVSEVKEDEVTLDANHPLAGQTLIFEVELVEIG
jgi:peptidylprolyl isomerase